MSSDRRRDPRQPAETLKARVRFADRRQLERCYLKDISRGGIFLRTKSPSPLDADIEVTLELPDGQEVLLVGTVVHRIGADEARPGQSPGIGVQFTNLTKQVRRRLEAVLEVLATPTGLVAPPAAAPSPDAFDERKTDPRTQRQAVAVALVPDAPIIEEEAAPPPRRAPTGGGHAVGAAGAGAAAADSLRLLLWHLADAERLAGLSHYAVLGVAADASAFEIHAACEALRRALDVANPPAGTAPEAVVRVRGLLDALAAIEACLGDPERRAAYDRGLP